MEGCDGHWGTWGADLLLSDQVSLLSSFLLTTAAQPGKHPAHCCRSRNGGAGRWSKAVLGSTVSAGEGEQGVSAVIHRCVTPGDGGSLSPPNNTKVHPTQLSLHPCNPLGHPARGPGVPHCPSCSSRAPAPLSAPQPQFLWSEEEVWLLLSAGTCVLCR